MYSVGVRNVHHEGHEAVTELSLQTIGVSLLAHRTELAHNANSACIRKAWEKFYKKKVAEESKDMRRSGRVAIRTLTTRSTAAEAVVTTRKTLSRELPQTTFAITRKMATNDPAFVWLRDEIAAIRSRRFHIFTPVSDADLEYRHGRKRVQLRGTFASFLREFGWAQLYTDDGDAPLVSVYPLSSTRRFVLSDGDTYIGFGYCEEQSVFFREAQILAEGVSPVFEGMQDRVVMVNKRFEQWLKESYVWARSTFSAKAWKKIVEGPKPFSAREQRIVAARTQIKWRHVGFAKNGDAIFEVTNGSDMTLPFNWGPGEGWNQAGGRRVAGRLAHQTGSHRPRSAGLLQGSVVAAGAGVLCSGGTHPGKERVVLGIRANESRGPTKQAQAYMISPHNRTKAAAVVPLDTLLPKYVQHNWLWQYLPCRDGRLWVKPVELAEARQFAARLAGITVELAGGSRHVEFIDGLALDTPEFCEHRELVIWVDGFGWFRLQAIAGWERTSTMTSSAN
jgi:hypothetical protein